MTKAIIQRNLPLNKRYSFVSATYISIFDGGGMCENCGKIISNIVTVKDEDNKYYCIGSDCAKTLTSLQQDAYFQLFGLSGFDEGKKIRSKILKAQKKGTITGFYYYTSASDKGEFIVYKLQGGGSSMEKLNYPEITKQYIKDLN